MGLGRIRSGHETTRASKFKDGIEVCETHKFEGECKSMVM